MRYGGCISTAEELYNTILDDFNHGIIDSETMGKMIEKYIVGSPAKNS
jgi:hypothetical protein